MAGRVTAYELAVRRGGHAGYLFSLNLDVALGQAQRWRLGAKSTLQNGLGGNTTSPTHNLTLARRLR